jgi:hypothetical protein
MKKLTVNEIEYEYETEGVFDDMYALKIQLVGGMIVHLKIYRDSPTEEYIKYLIERIQET